MIKTILQEIYKFSNQSFSSPKKQLFVIIIFFQNENITQKYTEKFSDPIKFPIKISYPIKLA